eukprot:7388863-Prymnesium_polylepis.2
MSVHAWGTCPRNAGCHRRSMSAARVHSCLSALDSPPLRQRPQTAHFSSRAQPLAVHDPCAHGATIVPTCHICAVNLAGCVGTTRHGYLRRAQGAGWARTRVG